MTQSNSTTSVLSQDKLAEILQNVENARNNLIDVTQKLVRIPSETPPSDTRAIVQLLSDILSKFDQIDTEVYTSKYPIDNLVATVRSGRPGKRLVLNGHLDTYPAGNISEWSDSPYSGLQREGKIFGRGSADMKGGIACLLQTFLFLAQMRDSWTGELSLVLAGDEESMGTLGSQFLLDTVREARGDAMICADVGSPIVPRIGEKGMIWIDVFAAGKPAHGAHVHRGDNAIDAIRLAMDELSKIESYQVDTPVDVAKIIDNAKSVSEPLSGDGETRVLKQVTVNFGRISGGQTANLVPDCAEVNADIRLPMGTSVAKVEAEIGKLLNPLHGIRFEITRRYEPSWTLPNDPVVKDVLHACETVLTMKAVANMRVGASDARLYRAAGVPTVVCGLTPNNLGGPDEYVEINELVDVTKILTLSALNFLSSNSTTS